MKQEYFQISQNGFFESVPLKIFKTIIDNVYQMDYIDEVIVEPD